MKPVSAGRLGNNRLELVHDAIVGCERCPRLRAYCRRIAREKRRAFRDDTYWGRPVPGFGDRTARVLLVGLAPAAHGANRTGRVFTGDGPQGSGDFLMAALHHTGFANQSTSTRIDDGLVLEDAFIAMAVRCAPPDNAPQPDEITRCLDHLEAETAALERVQVMVAQGRIAFDVWLRIWARRGVEIPRPKPRFAHGAVVTAQGTGRSQTLIGCYHPSRQNTNTGRLTPPMMTDIFSRATRLLR